MRIPEILSLSCLQISLLTIMIPSFFYWISPLFSILLSIDLHHISGVSSLDFAPEGAGWLHHWTSLLGAFGSLFYILFYIIFLVCHLSISLPRGQDDYIILTKFQLNLNLIAWSIWLPFLMSLSLGASHHLGHHVSLFLTSLSSAHHLSTSYNISYFEFVGQVAGQSKPWLLRIKPQ